MKINSIVLSKLTLKLILGLIIFLAGAIDRDRQAVASSLKFPRNNSYGLQEAGDFSLNLNRNVSSQVEQEILPQNFDVIDYIDLVTQDSSVTLQSLAELDEREILWLNTNQSSSPAEIIISTQTTAEDQRLLESLLGSLRNLELRTTSGRVNRITPLPVLGQVNYRDVYRDVYDFDISLTNASQRSASRITAPSRTGNTLLTQSSLQYSYRASYLQNNQSSYSYGLSSSEARNINSANASFLLTPRSNSNLSSLSSVPSANSSLVPIVPNGSNSLSNSSLSSLLNLPSANLPLVPNQNRSSLIGSSSSNSYNRQNYAPLKDTDSILKDIEEARYNNLPSNKIPSSEIESYEIQDFKVRSNLDLYEKPKHQQTFETNVEKRKKIVEQQREKLYENIKRLRERREEDLARKREKYNKERRKQLSNTIKAQQKLQEQRQNQSTLY